MAPRVDARSGQGPCEADGQPLSRSWRGCRQPFGAGQAGTFSPQSSNSSRDWTGPLLGGGRSTFLESHRPTRWRTCRARRLSARPRRGRASSNSKARDAIGSRQPEPHELPPGENWVDAGGLPDWGSSLSMAPLKPRQTFPFGDPPVETFPHLHGAGVQATPTGCQGSGDIAQQPPPPTRSEDPASWVLRRHCGKWYSETACRSSSRKAWQTSDDRGSPALLPACGCRSSQPDQGPSLNTPLQPWAPAVDFPLSPARAKTLYWAEPWPWWIHGMRIPAL